jgi:hypothetical protein
MARSILPALQEFVDQPLHRAAIEQACDECAAELRARPALEMTYRVVIPELKLTGEMAALRSLWVFAFTPGGESDIHKHSNSTQYTRAWRGEGSIRIGEPEHPDEVQLPPSLLEGLTEQEWIVIPIGTFHQAAAGAGGWCVISFQTAPAGELQDEPYDGEPHYYIENESLEISSKEISKN